MSQVKNLRAMFEQKGDTSPPDRGRSPGIPPSGTESPRPLSTIRTSFIAVEKDGRIGLQRDPSRDSSLSVSTTRNASGEVDTATPPALVEKANTFDKMDKTSTKTSLREQPIPESPRTDTASQAAGQVAKKSHDPKVQTASNKAETPKTGTELGVGAKGKTAVNGHGPAAPNGVSGEKVNGTNGNKEKSKGKEAARANVKTSTATTPAIKVTPKTTPILTAKTSTKPLKSPTAAKAPKSPVTTGPKLPTKTPEKTTLHPEKAATPRAAASASKPGASTSATKRPPPLQHPSGVGFVKPKPKSPTRPVKLPPSLTTHTAASVSKLNVPRQSLSRASGTLQPGDSFGRSPSRISVSTVATTATAGGKGLRRQSSTINRPRPSLGLPSKPKAKDHPPTRKEKEIDDGFLARMMRPTQASSSKVAEKVPTTPPRKTASTRATPKSEAKRAPRITAGAAEPASAHPPRPESSLVSASEPSQATAVQDASVIASQLPNTATDATEEHAEEVSAAQGHSPEAEPAEKDTAEDTAQEVASVAEQAETAEEAIEVAKEVEGEVKLPEEPKSQDPLDSLLQPDAETEQEAAATNGDDDVSKPDLNVPAGEEEDEEPLPNGEAAKKEQDDKNDEIESY